MATTSRYWVSLAWLAIIGILVGCEPAPAKLTEATGIDAVIDSYTNAELISPEQSEEFPPAISSLGNLLSLTRRASDDAFEANGVDVDAESAGCDNFVPLASPQSYAIVPGAGLDMSWARYGVAGITADRPVQLKLFVSQATAGEGGEDLPVSFFIGVANFTQYCWDWWGPFKNDSLLFLNHPAGETDNMLCERYIDESGVLQVIVVTGSATGMSDCAVQIDRAEVTTSSTYVWNKPHYVWFEDAHTGSSFPKEAKWVSALKPEQFVNLSIKHVAAFDGNDIFNAPDFYNIRRKGSHEIDPEIVGQVLFPGSSFCDPVDLANGVSEPIPGTTYEYFIYAKNAAGETLPATTRITVPILPPDNLTASLDGEAAEYTLVSWSEVVGTTAYEVWRGFSPVGEAASLIGTVNEETLSFEDSTALPGMKYWYFVRTTGFGDGDETNGLEVGSVSDYSLGSEGLRRVVLSIADIEPAVSGSGSEADPYVLSTGNTYQFKAFDQIGRELTILCLWETDPEPAGVFDGITTGLLGEIQSAPNEFTVSATYNFSTYSWVCNSHCSVE